LFAVIKRQRIAMVGYTTFQTDPRLMRHVGKLVKSGFDVDVVTLASSDFGRESNTEHIHFFLPMTRRYERQNRSNIIIDYCYFTFFDLPAIREVPSGLRLAGMLDGVVFVVEAQVVHCDERKCALDLLVHARANLPFARSSPQQETDLYS
jgi:hypothetical protein